MKKILFIFLMLNNYFYSQTVIHGEVKDDESQEVVKNAIVTLYKDTDRIVKYTKSDTDGKFSLSDINTGIYTVKVSHISYYSFSTEIVIGTSSKKEVAVTIELQRKSKEMEGLEVKSSPIIVKEDTVIYKTQHYTEVRDESLEEVLAKIPGFKINADGSIEANGRVIRKVLIDGKEVSDVGAGILTKNINPKDVKEVEIRYKEKNKKIKESLLEGEDFTVLDIKLKPDVNKSFFGKAATNIGYSDKPKLGADFNSFSLNKKLNLQVFGETHQLLENNIELKYIKNIGSEAFQKLFDMPADFNELKQKENYENELFGFDNFTQNDHSIVGISSNYNLSKTVDIYFGSFNAYNFMRNNFRETQQDLASNSQELYSNFFSSSSKVSYNSINKVQLKWLNDKVKLFTDFNYEYYDHHQSDNNREFSNAQYRNLKTGNYQNRYNINLAFEYKLNENNFIFYNSHYSNEQYNSNKNLIHNQDSLATFLGSSIQTVLYNFNQKNKNRERKIANEIGYAFLNKLGTNKLYVRNINTNLKNVKLSGNSQQQQFVFINPEESKTSNNNSIFYELQTALGDFSTSIKLHYDFLKYPENRKKSYFLYDLTLNYSISELGNLSLSTNKYVSTFPLYNSMKGLTLVDFQNILQPNYNLEPIINQTTNFVFDTTINNYKTNILLAVLYGKTNNVGSQFPENSYILNFANNLSSHYTALSLNINHQFSKIPLSIILEPEMLNNNAEYISNSETFTSKYNRYLLGLKLKSTFKKPVNFSLHSKYSNFISSNTENDFKNYFKFLSNSLHFKADIENKNLYFDIFYKNVYFLQSKNSTFNNLDAKISYLKEKLRFYLLFSNILNSKSFVTQDINISLLNTQYNSIFQRFINIGVKYKF